MKHSNRGRKTDHGKTSLGVSEEIAFEFGVVYSTIKDELIAFAAKTRGAYLFSDIATRVARLLEVEAVRQQYRGSELVPEMWEDGNATGRGRPPRNSKGMAANLSRNASGRRTLSAEARERIAEAQRKRWARTKEKRARWREQSRKSYKKRHGAGSGSGQKSYWAKFTPAQRQKEMQRRMKLAAEKRAAKKAG